MEHCARLFRVMARRPHLNFAVPWQTMLPIHGLIPPFRDSDENTFPAENSVENYSFGTVQNAVLNTTCA